VTLLFAACCAAWLGISLTFSREIAGGLLPLMRWEISWLAPQYQFTELRVTRTGLEDVIQAQVTTSRLRILGGELMSAGIPLQSSTLVGHLLQPLVLMLSLVSSACLIRRERCVVLALLSFPAALVVVMMDVPVVLVGAIGEVVMFSAPPSLPVPSGWVVWMNFLNGGGRIALGIGAALSVMLLAEVISARTRTFSPNHPPGLRSL